MAGDREQSGASERGGRVKAVMLSSLCCEARQQVWSWGSDVVVVDKGVCGRGR